MGKSGSNMAKKCPCVLAGHMQFRHEEAMNLPAGGNSAASPQFQTDLRRCSRRSSPLLPVITLGK
jgi:hypothetical protein